MPKFGRDSAFAVTLSRLLAVVVILIVVAGLLGSLLLLALALLLASVAGKGLLEDLEDLGVLNLLVRLNLGEVKGGGATKLGETVLGDGCEVLAVTSCYTGTQLSCLWRQITYQQWSAVWRRERRPFRRQSRTGGRRCRGRTRRHQTWRHARRRAVSS